MQISAHPAQTPHSAGCNMIQTLSWFAVNSKHSNQDENGHTIHEADFFLDKLIISHFMSKTESNIKWNAYTSKGNN